ncbi:hypothetical protein RND71_042524 [Anisodus tanguticus]|uniref:non-specific serine/threonine protein kinase n=1 Tax=Anisodus tanguticus TaxID=243964 RepID=A0AAE1QTK4_9SOLA|nr:hypothetical protein RND71_042524 [Anisodus tanguticus]
MKIATVNQVPSIMLTRTIAGHNWEKTRIGAKAYNSHIIGAPSPLIGLPEFSHLGWGHWITLTDLELATGRFSKENILFYRGNLINGTPIAIKKLLNNMDQTEKEFQEKCIQR